MRRKVATHKSFYGFLICIRYKIWSWILVIKNRQLNSQDCLGVEALNFLPLDKKSAAKFFILGRESLAR